MVIFSPVFSAIKPCFHFSFHFNQTVNVLACSMFINGAARMSAYVWSHVDMTHMLLYKWNNLCIRSPHASPKCMHNVETMKD